MCRNSSRSSIELSSPCSPLSRHPSVTPTLLLVRPRLLSERLGAHHPTPNKNLDCPQSQRTEKGSPWIRNDDCSLGQMATEKGSSPAKYGSAEGLADRNRNNEGH